MSDQNIQNSFNRLKQEGEANGLSKDHQSRFEQKLKANVPTEKGKTWSILYKIAAILIFGALLTPVIYNSNDDIHPEYEKYQETKNYFTAYVEYEIGRHQEGINPDNERLILSALQEVVKLKYDYNQLELEFIKQNYDKRILKRMIDNFRQQLDILENIDNILKSSKTTTNNDENII